MIMPGINVRQGHTYEMYFEQHRRVNFGKFA